MTGATCSFCDRRFRNQQAVRAHLRFCDAYRQGSQASVPSKGTVPKAPVARRPFIANRPPRGGALGSGRTRPRIPRLDRAEAHDFNEHEAADQEWAAPAAERQRRDLQHEEITRRWEQAREAARLRAQHEAEARARREAAEREAREQRRRIIQRVKQRVIREQRPLGYTIPAETEARALDAIERDLSRRPVEDLPESELVTIAEGIRDPIYQPVTRAQDRAREAEEEKQTLARRRTELIDFGVAYAGRELSQEHDVDGWTRLTIAQRVKQTLEQEIDGSESEADVRALADEVVDRELEDAAGEQRERARPELIAHGTAYAARALAREKDLDVRARWEIEKDVKRALEQEITGDESERDVEDLIDEMLEEELGETEADDGF